MKKPKLSWLVLRRRKTQNGLKRLLAISNSVSNQNLKKARVRGDRYVR